MILVAMVFFLLDTLVSNGTIHSGLREMSPQSLTAAGLFFLTLAIITGPQWPFNRRK